jgi:CRP/FNR family cyclic AMP-dependent transcriptional regulator
VANVAMGKDVIRGCLKTVSLFADLSDGELDVLASAARPVRFSRGARIFEEDAPADCCFVLTSGKARVVLSGENGSEILLHIVTPPGVVGEMALLDRSKRSASLVATEDCHLLRIPAPALAVLRANPAFEQRLVARLVATLRESNDHVRVITSLPCLLRVAWCLARIARYAGERRDGAILIPNTPHTELAEMAACTRETVNRALTTMKRKKYVTWDRHTMRLDVGALQRLLTTELTVPREVDPSPPS